MGGELSSLAARTVANGTGASPETAALVAALVDDPSLARKALHSSGLSLETEHMLELLRSLKQCLQILLCMNAFAFKDQPQLTQLRHVFQRRSA